MSRPPSLELARAFWSDDRRDDREPDRLRVLRALFGRSEGLGYPGDFLLETTGQPEPTPDGGLIVQRMLVVPPGDPAQWTAAGCESAFQWLVVDCEQRAPDSQVASDLPWYFTDEVVGPIFSTFVYDWYWRQKDRQADGAKGSQTTADSILIPAVNHPRANRRPTKEEVWGFASQVYEDGKRPNIAEAEKLIRKSIRAAFTKAAEKNVIRDVLDESEFAEKRRKPGKQVIDA